MNVKRRATAARPRFLILLPILIAGCQDIQHQNTADWVTQNVRVSDSPLHDRFMKGTYYEPVRDFFDSRAAFNPADPNQPAAWNVDENGQVHDGSFFTNRDIAAVSPEAAGIGPAANPPVGPWKVLKKPDKHAFKLRRFLGEDATGRKFLVKVDHEDHPQGASAVSAVATRVYWLLGYNVPAEHIVTIEGTGDEDFDGKRGFASEFIPGDVKGFWRFDWFRFRREVRAIRLVAAWLDDIDRTDSNTLLTFHGDRNLYYLIDFDSSLGLWQGRAKLPWMGHRHAWDPNWVLLSTIGLAPNPIIHHEPVSDAVGLLYADDFDPFAWKQQIANSAFRLMARSDAEWIARRMAQVSREQLAAIVHAARYSNPEDERYVLETLMARRVVILKQLGIEPIPSPTQPPVVSAQ